MLLSSLVPAFHSKLVPHTYMTLLRLFLKKEENNLHRRTRIKILETFLNLLWIFVMEGMI